MTSSALPIVFLGPSMEVAEARLVLEADYRPPIRRDDLVDVPAGSVVGIIDGEFEQNLSVSPREIVVAIRRGVVVFGASSMGALRAAEVPAVRGIGRIVDLYRSGAIDRDDEVALLFDPDTKRAITEPMVNVRHAVETLVGRETVSQALGERILRAAVALHYRDRSYPRILRDAGLSDREDVRTLIAALKQVDLKHADAHSLLLAIKAYLPLHRPADVPEVPALPRDDHYERVVLADRIAPDAPLMVWEVGDQVAAADLLLFLRMTGQFLPVARDAVARFVLQGNELESEDVADEEVVGDLLVEIARRWGWKYETEIRVVLRDLGIGWEDLQERLEEEAVARARVMAQTTEGSPELLTALRVGLLLDDLALKRAVFRCGSLRSLAAAWTREPDAETLRAAQRKLCIANGCDSWSEVLAKVLAFGVSEAHATAFAADVARARSAARARMARRRPAASGELPALSTPGLVSRKKHDQRFAISIAEAMTHVERLKRLAGISRVALLGELSTLGVQISQACRPDGTMSSTYGSGKALSDEGAIVGGVMEEVEKWAMEQARNAHHEDLIVSYAALRREDRAAVDPATLDLPHDSIYRPDLEIGWVPCCDLATGASLLFPSAVIFPRKGLMNNIMFSPRNAGITNFTNGLASGFALEEALVHALCEVVERHCNRIADLRISNPGGLRPVTYPVVDLGSLRGETCELVARLSVEHEVSILSIGDAIGIPTMRVLMAETEGGTLCEGSASHPDPDLACRMALLEAAQTLVANMAGGREDLSLRARSLGRHERSRPRSPRNDVPFFDPDRPRVSIEQITSFHSDDALDELRWVVQRIVAAGFPQVAFFDLTHPEMHPARAVFVKVPGLESINPFYTGHDARLEVLWDLVPTGG